MAIDGTRPLTLISFDSIMNDPLPPIIWDVERLIVRGNRMVVYGEFGSMKSWLLLDLALHLAAGKPWLGHFPVPEPRRVLYIDEEMSRATMWRRVKRLGDGAGLGSASVDFRVASHCGLRCDEEGMAAWLDALAAAAFDPDVVIIETMRRVLKGSENSAEDVAAMWRALDVLAKAGKTVILSHHMRKPKFEGNDSARNRASGSTDILAGPDAAYAIVRKGKTMLITVGCEKSRDAEEAPPFCVELIAPGSDRPASLAYQGEAQQGTVDPSKLEEAKGVIMALFDAVPRVLKTADILDHAGQQGVAKKTAETALHDLKKSGKVKSPNKGLYEWPEIEEQQAA